MVREAVRLLGPVARPVAVDLCCGSGAVGAALLAAVPGLEVHAADVDPVAVRCARRNLPPGSVHAGDLYDALPASLRGRVHVLAANTPYVPTGAIATMPPEARYHEPAVALDGGPDGLDVARRVAAAAPGWLVPGGTLAVEASRGQASRLAEVFSSCGLEPQVVREDDLEATLVLGTLAT
jgi:release factor glutamine methyltransferase